MSRLGFHDCKCQENQVPRGPTPGIFFTRWITHFVAPAFCFLAGTGAFLHGRKLGDSKALARYLVTRYPATQRRGDKRKQLVTKSGSLLIFFEQRRNGCG